MWAGMIPRLNLAGVSHGGWLDLCCWHESEEPPAMTLRTCIKPSQLGGKYQMHAEGNRRLTPARWASVWFGLVGFGSSEPGLCGTVLSQGRRVLTDFVSRLF